MGERIGTGDISVASREELLAEAANLRSEVASWTPERREELGREGRRAMLDKVDEIDAMLTLTDMAETRAARPLASTRGGLIAEGQENFGQLIINDELVKWASRGAGEALSQTIDGHGSLAQLLTRAAVAEWTAPGSGQPTSYDGTGSGYLLPVGQPIAPVPRQARLFLRDLIPTMTTTLASLPYVQELTPTTYESASAVAENSTKPNATLAFTGQKADPTVIATTLQISKQMFDDSAAVVQYINQRLPYMVKFKEDNEFLQGSGNWPDMLGILNTPNVQGVTGTSAASGTAASFGSAFAAVENHDGTPTAVVLNPTQAWDMFTNRASTSGIFDAGTPFSALPLTVWGVPTYRTRAMPAGQALVGDFQLGAMIADREDVNVMTYRERYAELNQILLVCEERVGLMVFRPDLFVNVTSLV